MATIINNPPPPAQDNYPPRDRGPGFMIGIMLLLVFILLLFFYGLPAVVNAIRGSGTSIQVPNKIDVNLHNSGQ